jgi:hypothetical protein
MLLAAEIGFRVGRKRREKTDEAAKSSFGAMQGAILGTLGILLGFTLSMAVARYDGRRMTVVDEANDIGTCFLRTKLLPEPHRGQAAKLLREYIALRIEMAHLAIDSTESRKLSDHADDVLMLAWNEATLAVEADPRPVTTGLFIPSLNTVIDDKEKTSALNHHRVPESILWMLMLGAFITMGIVGYGEGLGSTRLPISRLSLVLLLGVVILVLIDLDRPRRGAIQVSQQSMVNTQEMMKKAPW